jgi:hypothetical protein
MLICVKVVGPSRCIWTGCFRLVILELASRPTNWPHIVLLGSVPCSPRHLLAPTQNERVDHNQQMKKRWCIYISKPVVVCQQELLFNVLGPFVLGWLCCNHGSWHDESATTCIPGCVMSPKSECFTAQRLICLGKHMDPVVVQPRVVFEPVIWNSLGLLVSWRRPHNDGRLLMCLFSLLFCFRMSRFVSCSSSS